MCSLARISDLRVRFRHFPFCPMRIKPLIAECLGTFLLALLVRLSLTGAFPVPTPLLAGLTLGLLVYMIGPISGAHVNPAVTLALASIGKIKLFDALGYIMVQFLGAIAAFLLVPVMVAAPTLDASFSLATYAGEAMGAALFLFGIASIVIGKVPKELSGVVIGSSLLLGALVASVLSNGILNPAVALTLGSLSVPYIIAPIVGAIVGAWGYKLLVR